MFGEGALTFREFVMREPLPLAMIHDAVLDFLRGRDDAVLFGAQAVNAYVEEPRMTQAVDILSTRAEELAEEIRDHLSSRFHIAVRIRKAGGSGFRLFQVQKSRNRHLVDVRLVETLPPSQRFEEVLVVEPAELIASKVIAFQRRRGTPKSGTDWRDLASLLLTFPEFKRESGPVAERLRAAGADDDALAAWRDLVAAELLPAQEDDEF